MDGFRNNTGHLSEGKLILDFRLNNNMCIRCFDSNGALLNHYIKWDEITFITDSQETQFWKTFHEEMSESINQVFNGEKIDIDDVIFTEMVSLTADYETNGWLWVVRDYDLIRHDGTRIDIIETYGEDSEEAKKYKVGKYDDSD